MNDELKRGSRYDMYINVIHTLTQTDTLTHTHTEYKKSASHIEVTSMPPVI